MTRLTVELASLFGCQSGWPMNNQRRADAALVHPMFVFPKRGVRDVGPAATVTDVSVRRSGHHVWALAHPAAITRLHRRPDLRLKIIRTERSQRFGRLGTVGISAHVFRATAVVLQEK